MNIIKIEVRNILGLEQIDITPGQITKITGPNGSGKSSVIGAIRAALGAADFPPAQLIHNGQETGEIVLVLDNGMKIQRRIKPDGTVVKVTDEDGNSFSKPQSVLDQLYAITQVNPLKLLQTDKNSRDERARIVLESIPLKVTHEDLLRLAPTLASQVRNIDVARHGLAVLDDAEKRVFDRRTDVNRDFKKSSAAIIEMKEALPSDTPGSDPLARLAELRAAKEMLDRKREDYMMQFEAEKDKAKAVANERFRKDLKAAEMQRNEAIQRANDEYDAAEAKLNAEFNRAMNETGEEYLRKRNEKQLAYNERVGPINFEIGRLEEQSRNAAAINKQREIIDKMVDENRDLALLADALTADVESLRAYRKTATAQMPIKGLELHDGEVFYNGLAFDQLNTAKRIELAVALAVQRSGELGIICVDGCEALDAGTMQLLEEAVLAADLQMICTGVADTPFGISVKEAV